MNNMPPSRLYSSRRLTNLKEGEEVWVVPWLLDVTPTGAVYISNLLVDSQSKKNEGTSTVVVFRKDGVLCADAENPRLWEPNPQPRGDVRLSWQEGYLAAKFSRMITRGWPSRGAG